MRINQPNRPDRIVNRPPARIRAGMLTAASVATGFIVAFAAAGGIGPFAGLRPYVASHLVQSSRALKPINAQTLFPKPPPIIQAAPRPHPAYLPYVPSLLKPIGPPQVLDDQVNPTQPAGTSDGHGGGDR